MDVKLHETFCVQGNDLEGFLDAIVSMDKCTCAERIPTEDLELLAVCNTPADISDIALISSPCDKISFQESYNDISDTVAQRLEADSLPVLHAIPGEKFILRSMNMTKMREKGITDELMKDLLTVSKMIIRHKDVSYIVSPLAFTTLLARAELGGAAMNRATVGRVAEIAKSFYFRNPQDVTMISRVADNTRIVLGVHSAKYAYVPQTILKDIYEAITRDFGKTKCVQWAVNHQISYCYAGFPDVAADMAKVYSLPDEIVPGMYISTSDSGDSSLIIRGFWTLGGKTIAGTTLKRTHRGEIDIDEFVQEAGREIFADYNTVPERLCELLTIDVKNPVKVLKNVFKQIGVTAILGKKKNDELYKALCSEYVPGAQYTAYDMISNILTVPDRCAGLSHSTYEKLELMAKKAIFADYTGKSKSEEDDESIVLTA